VLICDGDVNCPQTTIDLANSQNVKIYTVLIGRSTLIGGSTNGKEELQDIAEQIGGKFFYAQTAEEIRRALFDTQQEALEGVDTTDTDGEEMDELIAFLIWHIYYLPMMKAFPLLPGFFHPANLHHFLRL